MMIGTISEDAMQLLLNEPTSTPSAEEMDTTDVPTGVAVVVRAWKRGHAGHVVINAEGRLAAVVMPHVQADHVVAAYTTGRMATFKVMEFKAGGNDFVTLDDTALTHPNRR